MRLYRGAETHERIRWPLELARENSQKKLSEGKEKLEAAMENSQKKLAERLEISQDAMARMEKGRIAPKMGRLQDIADTLQCSPTCFALTMKLQKSGWSL